VQHTAKNCVPGRPFTRGTDPRRNTLGRPKNFDAFRELAQAIAHETTTDKNGNVITIAERILRSWAESKEPMLQRTFIEYAFGKPPDKIETTGLENKTRLILHYAHEMPGWKQPNGPTIAVNGEGTRRPLLPDADS
jgi:hypothetical protein